MMANEGPVNTYITEFPGLRPHILQVVKSLILSQHSESSLNTQIPYHSNGVVFGIAILCKE